MEKLYKSIFFFNSKVSGWGYDENSKISEILVKAELPYISFISCLEMLNGDDKQTISFDKFCVGNNSG